MPTKDPALKAEQQKRAHQKQREKRQAARAAKQATQDELAWDAPDHYQRGELKGNRVTPRFKYLIHEMRFLSQWNLSADQIAAKLGVSRDALLKVARCAPVPAITERVHEEHAAEFLRMRLERAERDSWRYGYGAGPKTRDNYEQYSEFNMLQKRAS